MDKDHHELIEDLVHCKTGECYPSRSKFFQEYELENFAKQVIAAVNVVLRDSNSAYAANIEHEKPKFEHLGASSKSLVQSSHRNRENS